MGQLDNQLEATFMNSLPFSLRGAAAEVYRYMNLKEMLEIRLGKIPAALAHHHHFNESQWREIGNAVVLTKCSQIHLSSHLSKACLLHLHKIVASALDLPQSSLEDIHLSIKDEAPFLAAWVLRLNKLLK